VCVVVDVLCVCVFVVLCMCAGQRVVAPRLANIWPPLRTRIAVVPCTMTLPRWRRCRHHRPPLPLRRRRPPLCVASAAAVAALSPPGERSVRRHRRRRRSNRCGVLAAAAAAAAAAARRPQTPRRRPVAAAATASPLCWAALKANYMCSAFSHHFFLVFLPFPFLLHTFAENGEIVRNNSMARRRVDGSANRCKCCVSPFVSLFVAASPARPASC